MTAAHCRSTAAGEEPIGDILRRAADQLKGSAHAIEAIAAPVGQVIELEKGAGHFELLRAAQNLDHARQQLDSVANFLRAIASAAPAHWRLDAGDAVSLVTLSDLARRLRSSEAAPALASVTSGKCELF